MRVIKIKKKVCNHFKKIGFHRCEARQTQIHSNLISEYKAIMQIENKKRTRKHSFLPFGKPIPSDDDGVHSSDQVIKRSKPGWKAMPYILGRSFLLALPVYIILSDV